MALGDIPPGWFSVLRCYGDLPAEVFQELTGVAPICKETLAPLYTNGSRYAYLMGDYNCFRTETCGEVYKSLSDAVRGGQASYSAWEKNEKTKKKAGTFTDGMAVCPRKRLAHPAEELVAAEHPAGAVRKLRAAEEGGLSAFRSMPAMESKGPQDCAVPPRRIRIKMNASQLPLAGCLQPHNAFPGPLGFQREPPVPQHPQSDYAGVAYAGADDRDVIAGRTYQAVPRLGATLGEVPEGPARNTVRIRIKKSQAARVVQGDQMNADVAVPVHCAASPVQQPPSPAAAGKEKDQKPETASPSSVKLETHRPQLSAKASANGRGGGGGGDKDDDDHSEDSMVSSGYSANNVMLQTAVVTLALTAVEAYAEESVETLADRLADKASRLPNTEQYRSLNCSAGKLQNAVEVYCNSMANMDARYAQGPVIDSVLAALFDLCEVCLPEHNEGTAG